MSCTLAISNGIARRCSPLPGGAGDKLILLNFNDILGYTVETNAPTSAGDKYIDAITRAVATKGYLFEGQNNSINPVKTGERGTYWLEKTTTINFIAFDDTGIVEKTVEDLGNSLVVAAYESNGEYHIVGLEGGMLLQTATSDTNDADARGGFSLVLTATKESEYSKRIGVWTGTSPNQVYDKAASKVVFEGLLTTVPTP